MKRRLVPIALAALLALATARVPAATAAGPSLSMQQTEEIVASYTHLTAEFYKQVDRQAVLDGARTSMVDYLKKHHVTNATLPALHASDDDVTNVEALNREVATAVSEYAPKLEPVESISPSSQITYAAISGVLGSVKDRYTVFLSPKEYAALNEGLDGTSFGGVEDAPAAHRERGPRRPVGQSGLAVGRRDNRGRRQADRADLRRRDDPRGAAETRLAGASR
jgi:hypothetical protein